MSLTLLTIAAATAQEPQYYDGFPIWGIIAIISLVFLILLLIVLYIAKKK